MNKGWVEWVANSYQTYWQRAGSLDSPFQTIYGVWFPCLFLLDGCSSWDFTSYIKDGAPEDATILCPRSNPDWHLDIRWSLDHDSTSLPYDQHQEQSSPVLPCRSRRELVQRSTHPSPLGTSTGENCNKNSSNLQPCPSNQIPLCWVQDSAAQYCGGDLSDSQGSHRDCLGHASSVPHVIIAFYDPCKVTSYSWSTSLH